MVPRVRDKLKKSLREREDNNTIRPTRKRSKEEDNPERKRKICEDGRKTRSSKAAKLVAGGATTGWLVDGDAKSSRENLAGWTRATTRGGVRSGDREYADSRYGRVPWVLGVRTRRASSSGLWRQTGSAGAKLDGG